MTPIARLGIFKIKENPTRKFGIFCHDSTGTSQMIYHGVRDRIQTRNSTTGQYSLYGGGSFECINPVAYQNLLGYRFDIILIEGESCSARFFMETVMPSISVRDPHLDIWEKIHGPIPESWKNRSVFFSGY